MERAAGVTVEDMIRLLALRPLTLFPSWSLPLAICLAASGWSPHAAVADEVLVEDDFNRTERDDSKEEVGGGWSTNSRSRAKGNKQVDLREGALFMRRHEEADHGVSTVHEAAFADATITLRFKLGPNDDLGLNIADMAEKSVHAGHICMARVRPRRVELHDLKTGNMRLDVRDRRKAGEETPEDKALVARKKKVIPVTLTPNEWHDLELVIEGETMRLAIDGQPVGQFTSEGIGHPTKSRLRLAVNREAWVDDVKIVRND